MSIELLPASTDDMAAFKLAAARRYAEKGIAPDVADQLFTTYMGKLAGEMGLTPEPDARIVKLADTIRLDMEAKKEASDKPQG